MTDGDDSISPFPTQGRLVGVDFGLARIGLAISDPDRILCSPLEIYQPRNERLDTKFFQQLAHEERVAAFVVGLPIHLSGRESEMSQKARKFGRWLSEITGKAVVLFDERYSTSMAEEHLQLAGLTSKQRKKRRDMLAAQILLQAFIESGDSGESEPLPLED